MKALYCYAIRERGTERYLPELKTRGRGYSWTDLELDGGQYGPRLHFTEQAARNARSAWRRGQVEVTYLSEGQPFNQLIPKPERKLVSLEIVTFRLWEVAHA